jgi:hypothetical protein
MDPRAAVLDLMAEARPPSRADHLTWSRRQGSRWRWRPWRFWASWESCLTQSTFSKGNPRPVDQSMVELLASYPPWRRRLGASLLQSISSPSPGSSEGNPRSGSSGLYDGSARRRSPPWGHHFEVGVGWRALRRSDLHLPHRRQRDSAMWRSRVSAMDMA